MQVSGAWCLRLVTIVGDEFDIHSRHMPERLGISSVLVA